MNKKIKFLIVFLFFFLLSILINCNVFATFNFTYEDEEHILPDLPFNTFEHPDYVILYNYKDDIYSVGYPSFDYQTPFYYQQSKSSTGRGVQYWLANDTEKEVIGPIYCDNLNWDYYSTTQKPYETWSEQKTTSQNQLKTVNNTPCANIVYSSVDIINEDGTIFFQPTPTEKTKTLAEIMKTAGEQATAEVGQIILIVIMITAGLTVLLIGLKKGLTVLKNGFRH